MVTVMIVVTNEEGNWQEAIVDDIQVAAGGRTMTFIAPNNVRNIEGATGNTFDGWGFDVTVQVFYQQVLGTAVAENGFYQIEEGNDVLTYHYGGLVYYASDATVNGHPASTSANPDSFLHLGMT